MSTHSFPDHMPTNGAMNYFPEQRAQFTEAGFIPPKHTDIAFTASPKDAAVETQDRAIIDPAALLYGVLDGVGSHEDGAGAAENARQAIFDYFQDVPLIVSRAQDANDQMERAFTAARDALKNEGIDSATTATIARIVLIEGKPHVSVGHAGDSRLFIRDEHGMVSEIVAEQGYGHIITNAVSSYSTNSQDVYTTVPFKPGSRMMLCSDGLTGDYEEGNTAKKPADRISHAAIGTALRESTPNDSLASLLHLSTKSDDTTCLILDLPSQQIPRSNRQPKNNQSTRRRNSSIGRTSLPEASVAQPNRQISRRGFLAVLGVSAAVLVAAKLSQDSHNNIEASQVPAADAPIVQAPNTVPSAETSTQATLPAEAPANLEAAQLALTEIRRSLGITEATYWQANTAPDTILASLRVSANATGFLAPHRLVSPVYPAAVMEQAAAINAAALAYSVPADILAIIATMESAGNTMVKSPMLAQGLFQVVAKNASGHDVHGERVRRILGQPDASDEAVISALNTPTIAAKVAADIVREYHTAAVNANPGLHPGSLLLWAHTLAAYNGGPSLAGVNLEASTKQMPIESALYAKQAVSFMDDAEVATQMRIRGYSDTTIRWAMSSPEMNAEAYAYAAVKNDYLDPLSIQNGYEVVIAPLISGSVQKGINPYHPELLKITNAASQQAYDEAVKNQTMAAALIAAYTDYKAGALNLSDDLNETFAVMVPPALRMWLLKGGYSLFKQTAENTVPENYTKPH